MKNKGESSSSVLCEGWCKIRCGLARYKPYYVKLVVYSARDARLEYRRMQSMDSRKGRMGSILIQNRVTFVRALHSTLHPCKMFQVGIAQSDSRGKPSRVVDHTFLCKSREERRHWVEVFSQFVKPSLLGGVMTSKDPKVAMRAKRCELLRPTSPVYCAQTPG